MDSYLLEIDSSQRDVDTHPNTNDYTIELNRPLYGVSDIKLVSGYIPFSQYTIDSHNSNLYYDSVLINLTTRNYTNGDDFASNVQSDIRAGATGASGMTVVFDSTTDSLTFSNASSFVLNFTINSPAYTMGFVTGSYSGTVITSNAIDLDGPNALILSLGSDARVPIENDISQLNYTQYMGRILKSSGNFIGRDDPVEHKFNRGSETSITSLNIKFYSQNFGQTIPYDFKLRNHVLKFEIKCSLDKFIVTKENENVKRMFELPPEIKLPSFTEGYRVMSDKRVLVYGGAAIVLILIVMILASFKTKSIS